MSESWMEILFLVLLAGILLMLMLIFWVLFDQDLWLVRLYHVALDLKR